MKVLGQPIIDVDDWAMELALLFASGAAPEAQVFAERRRCERALSEAQRIAGETESARTQLNAQLSEVQQALAETTALPPELSTTKLIMWCAAIAAVLFVIIAMAISNPLPLIFTLLFAGAFFYYQSVAKKLGAEHDQGRLAKQQQYDALQTQLANATAAQTQALGEITTNTQRLGTLIPKKSLLAVGRLYLPLATTELAGHRVVVDRAGVVPRVEVKLPDLMAQPGAVDRVREAVARASHPPVLLNDDRNDPVEIDEVLGEERELQGAVGEFTSMVDAVPVVSASLPLVPNDHPLAKYISTAKPNVSGATPPGVMLGAVDSRETTAALAKLTAVTQKSRALGAEADKAFRGLFDGLAGVLKHYGELRSGALEQLHYGLHEILQRSDLAYVTYYCPRCNRVPKYLFHRLGVDLDHAHELQAEALIAALQADDEARERLTRDETAMADIATAWGALRELGEMIAQRESVSVAGTGETMVNLAELQANESRMRALRAQHAQAVEQFKAALTRALTGYSRPPLELSQSARLTLDPETGRWSCGACATEFDDPAVARMGRMLKAKDQLMMPLWNHLWAEKDDLRKTELFRTNENLQALMEKEAQALRDVAEQYRADMRPVRENLILATTEAETKKDQLESTVASLEALGSISSEEANAWTARLMALTGGDLKTLRKRAEAKETLLNQEPQAQLGRRPRAIDPVQTFLSPGELFDPVEKGTAGLALAVKRELENTEVHRVG